MDEQMFMIDYRESDKSLFKAKKINMWQHRTVINTHFLDKLLIRAHSN